MSGGLTVPLGLSHSHPRLTHPFQIGPKNPIGLSLTVRSGRRAQTQGTYNQTSTELSARVLQDTGKVAHPLRVPSSSRTKQDNQSTGTPLLTRGMSLCFADFNDHLPSLLQCVRRSPGRLRSFTLLLRFSVKQNSLE